MTPLISLLKHDATSAISNRNMETDTMYNPNITPSKNILRGLTVSASVLFFAATLTGCGGALSGLGGPNGSGGGVSPAVHYTGNVHGGQQPVGGATIQLYMVSAGGQKNISQPLISSSVKTDSNGNFSITGTYSCASHPTYPVYAVATQGDPGSGTNTALSLMAAIGPCATLLANASTTSIQINELTTVAAAYALAPFAQDYAHIGASANNQQGIANAFLNAKSLVNITSGAAPGATLPIGATAPVSELNTLANIIAACVNTTGAASTQCMTLFGATGATETIGAALAIAQNPGSTAYTALYSLPTGAAPFQPSFSMQPNDFSVAINYSPSTPLSTPYGIAIDTLGNAYITNESGTTVSVLSSNGDLLGNIAPTGLVGAQGIATDRNGFVYIANTAGNSVIQLAASGANVTQTNTWTTNVAAPTALAVDLNSNVWVANFNGNSVAAFTSSGALVNANGPYTGGGNIINPSGIAANTNGDIFVSSANGSVVKLQTAGVTGPSAAGGGVYLASYTDNTLQGPVSVAVDPLGDLFMTGFTTGASVGSGVTEFSPTGVATLVAPVSLGISNPAGAASDGTSVWVANSTTSGSLAKLIYGAATSTSPATGFGSLNTPIGVAVDGSGSVWTANSGSNTVSKFVGIATATVTPMNHL